MQHKTFAICLSILLAACSSSQQPSRMPDTASAQPNATKSPGAVKPDVAKLRGHLEAHVQYPADRGKVLDACAGTPEFTLEERQWLIESLPEGQYASATQVGDALHL